MIRDVKYAKYHMDNELTGKIIKIDEGFSAITGYEWEDVQKNFYELRKRTDSNAIKLKSNDNPTTSSVVV